MSEWIKTAMQRPQKGQRIIYWFAPSEAAYVGFYDAETNSFVSRHGFCDQYDATHWMPLPAPPKPEGGT